jgi:uncharacterized protein YidB (DUF937 family)
MSVSAINSGAVSSASRVQGTEHEGAGHSNRKVALDAAASALSMTAADLKSALSGGQTIASLAQSKGISSDSVTSAISSALTSANPSMSADRAAQVAARFVAGPGRGESGERGGNDNDGDDRPVPVSA